VASKGAGSRNAKPGRSYRPRRLELAEGGALELDDHGLIRRIDAAGEVVERWAPDDAEWGRHAIRFGLTARARTVAPHGPGDPAPKTLGG
jgi:hypothetical protein